jgi:aconitate hydratase
MPETLTRKLLARHRADGSLEPGEPIALRFQQTLTQDATGTLVMLMLEAMGLDRVRTELSAQYVDHNLIQEDHRNPDDHLFLLSACRRFGVWYSRPGNGVSHPLHMQAFGAPGKSLIGADSHTPAAGALGMLAIGAGGADVATAMAGRPVWLRAPEVWGIELTGALPDWVSAKDVILELLRRHGVDGGVNRIIEYHGPGLAALSAMDRHVIANMGTELGATTTVFPSDEVIRRYLRSVGRDDDWEALAADDGAAYEHHDSIDLSELAPLIARPSSPDDVVPVREIAGADLYQAYVGSSANPGYRDFAVVAEMVRGRRVADHVSFDINPTSRRQLGDLIRNDRLVPLLEAGARLHQAGCNGCIGMGQAPASGRNSLRTTPRNFPGRSGTPEDSVFLCSPETAAASALAGRIADPRDLGIAYPQISEPARTSADLTEFAPPLAVAEAHAVDLVKGPNIAALPRFDALPDQLDTPVLLKLGDDISTDEIMPAGAAVLPYRSNIPKIAEFTFRPLHPGFADLARTAGLSGFAIVAGANYGQGSSREHAAVAPRYLGLRAVLARSFARIHWQNLINFGVLPLRFATPDDEEVVADGETLVLRDLHTALREGEVLDARLQEAGRTLRLHHDLTARQIDIVRAGGLINHIGRASAP